MLLTTVYDWATLTEQNASLKKQIAAAIANAAVQVLAESRDTENYADRRAWAGRVLDTPEGPLNMANQMIWGVLGNASVQGSLDNGGSVPDQDIAFVIATLVDTYAP